MTPPIDYAGGRDAGAERDSPTHGAPVTPAATPALRLGWLTIATEPLTTPAALEAASEAMAELGLADEPPAMWLVEQDEVNALLAGWLPGIAEVSVDRHPLGTSVYRVGERPHVLVQRGLPALAERSIIRHELCHLAQVRAGRLELFEAGRLGRWYVLPAGTVQELEAGGVPVLEAEAERFQRDARYWADRIAAGVLAPAGWTISLERRGPGQYEWRARRFVAGGLVEERVRGLEPSAAVRDELRQAGDAFLEAALGDPSIVERLIAGRS